MVLRRDGGQILEQVCSRLDELGQCWNDRFTLSNPRFAERYCEGEVDILVVLGFGDRNPEQHVAIIRRAPVLGANPEDHGWDFGGIGKVTTESTPHHGTEVDVGRLITAYHDQHGSVLVDDVQLIKLPDEVVIPSFVRLERLNRLDQILRGSLYFSANKSFQIIGRGNRGLPPHGKGGVRSAVRNGSAGEMVEGTPEVMNRIPAHQAERVGQLETRRENDSPLHVGSIVAFLTSMAIEVAIVESGDVGVEIADVLFGPLDLCPNSRQVHAES